MGNEGREEEEMTQGIPIFLRSLGVTRLVNHPIGYEEGETAGLLGFTGSRDLGRGKAIMVNGSLSEVERLITFIHELIHVIQPELSEATVSQDERKLLWWLDIESTKGQLREE